MVYGTLCFWCKLWSTPRECKLQTELDVLDRNFGNYFQLCRCRYLNNDNVHSSTTPLIFMLILLKFTSGESQWLATLDP